MLIENNLLIFQRPGPPVIHCSAGIGRTATLIGVDYGNQRIGEVGEMNVLDIVREMRQMRDKAVQSHHQFIFMLMCIADRMVLVSFLHAFDLNKVILGWCPTKR